MLRAAVKPALLDNVQDRDPHAEDVDEETLQASIQKARLNNIAIARAACGAGTKRTARAAQLLIQIHISIVSGSVVTWTWRNVPRKANQMTQRTS